MGELTGTPWLVVVVMVSIPIVVSAFLGAMTFRRMTPLVFRCRRCNRDFQRAAHRAFPAACPLCRARDWNA
jgi:Zn finger protein HypA/HybF involved in hydrogenase expression